MVRSALTLHTQETEISTRIVLTDCPQFVPDEIDERFGVVIFEMMNSKYDVGSVRVEVRYF